LKPLEPEKLVLIGASTGGPAHIEKILRALTADTLATFIVAQHMGAAYLPSFTKQLNEKCDISVALLQAGSTLERGVAYIATGKPQIVEKNGSLMVSDIVEVHANYNPDINHLFEIFSPYCSHRRILGIILTGIGDDGARGCAQLASQGARCIAESAESAIVYGMPMRAKEQVVGIEVHPLHRIIEIVREFGVT
jgi:two-component system, chemotaxis family, protein-glutamate methylesterase/glutaminase